MLVNFIQTIIIIAWSDLGKFLNQPIIIGLILVVTGIFALTGASMQSGSFSFNFQTSEGKLNFFLMFITGIGLVIIICEYAKYNILKSKVFLK